MKYFIVAIISIICFQATAQHIIRGKVLNEKGEPIHKASVFVPNSATGTLSDANGLFSLQVQDGNFTLSVSSVGYELFRLRVVAGDQQQLYVCRLVLKPHDLGAVVIHGFDKAGWPKWGSSFTEAFIGTSAFAAQCSILNKDSIRFSYLKEENALRADSKDPLIIENKALGYRITVQMDYFIYYLGNKEVEYQVYCFFTPMKGTEDEFVTWKQNRERAYAFSLMYFMRSLYNDDLKNKFEIHRLAREMNTEKQRVQELFRLRRLAVTDSLQEKKNNEKMLLALTEKAFLKDSLLYYKEVLQQDDHSDRIYPELINFADIAHRTDSGTVILSFKDYMLISNKRRKEPQQYVEYKKSLTPGGSLSTSIPQLPQYISTAFTLTEAKPVEIHENGYFVNTNLFITGFWSWWEKMATRLPYEYMP